MGENIDFNIDFDIDFDIDFLGSVGGLLGVCSCVENVRLVASLQDDGLMHGMLFALWPKTCRQQVLFLSRGLCKKG